MHALEQTLRLDYDRMFIELEYQLAKIIADWDRIHNSIRQTSKSFRWWVVVTVLLNFIAVCVSIISISKAPLNVPDHLEIYLPSLMNAFTTFYVLFAATRVEFSHFFLFFFDYCALRCVDFAYER